MATSNIFPNTSETLQQREWISGNGVLTAHLPTEQQRQSHAQHHVEQHTTHCHHCGELCADTSIQADDKAFCCEGCKFVYELLRDNNLCAYYDIENHAGVSLKNVPTIQRRSRFDYLEDETLQRQILEFRSGKVAKVTFYLPQIHCASCLWLLEKLYKLNDGVTASRVDFMRKEVNITYNPQQISLRGVVELLTTIGYEPELHLNALLDTPQSDTPQVDTLNTDANQRTKTSDKEKPKRSKQSVLTSLYLKIGIAGFAFGNTMIFSFPEYFSDAGTLDERLRGFFGVLSILMALPVLLYSASDYFKSSWQSLKRGHINLDVPIALGISALFIRSVVEIAHGATSGYLDSFTGLVLLLLCGKLFQQKTFDVIAFDRDYKSYFPIAVSVLRGGEETTIPLATLDVGERLFIRNAELVPADSVMESKKGHVDYSFVTGEASPVEVLQGDVVYAGGRIVGGAVEMTTQNSVSQSYLTSLWNNDAFQKHRKTALEEVSDRFGAWFTVFVLLLASAAFIAWMPDMVKAVNAATAVLVIACPCAMTLAAPFALGWALKIFGNAGLYVKNTSVVLELTRINTIVFDKTGTLTDSADSTVEFAGKDLRVCEQEYLAAALSQSSHPLTRSIAETMSYALVRGMEVRNFDETPARGFMCRVEGHLIRVGSAEYVAAPLFCEEFKRTISGKRSVLMPDLRSLDYPIRHYPATDIRKFGAEVHVAIDNDYKGFFTVKPTYRSGLRELFATLRRKYALFLLSGDNDAERERLSDLFGINANDDNRAMAFYQTPHDKLERVRELQDVGAHVAMIGDGLNDAGALKQSNVGIALASESGAFSPACDAVLSADKLARLSDFISFAGYTRRVIIAAFWISVVYNIVGLTFAVMGWLSPLVSAILMPVSNATVIGFTTLATIIGAKIRKL
ncbi:MAG: heavy metal translocating P-type ATPase metal-binding domain-containing protein [Candidatus Kapabacteria bacterium]|jgi:Cu+-exporting ATPase|nr:heavy metal translocating P-type ATPase metal-binding domain-containing protein [Candidatus Kapabacteria bacterium]